MLSNIHDSFFKSLFSVKENLQDLLQGTLPPEILNRANIETLEYDPTEYVEQDLAPYFKDICCNMSYGDSQIKISLLYEHKSYPAKHIHLQLLRYILNVWEKQSENKQELTPVVCIVFYHGRLKWIQRHILQTVAEELRRFVPMFDYVLFDTKDIEDHVIIQRFKSPDVKIGVWFLKRSINLIGFIRNNPALAKEIFKEINYIEKTNIQRIVFYLYNVSGEKPEKIDQIMKTISPEAKDAFDEFRLKLIEQGIEQGMEQGLKNIAVNMIDKGYSDDKIADITNLSIRRIQAIRKEQST